MRYSQKKTSDGQTVWIMTSFGSFITHFYRISLVAKSDIELKENSVEVIGQNLLILHCNTNKFISKAIKFPFEKIYVPNRALFGHWFRAVLSPF